VCSSDLYTDSAYDGGVLEISANGGAFTQVTPIAGYNRTFRTIAGGGNPFTGPMPGVPCYSDSITNWTLGQVDLSGYAGQNIQIRWRFGSDAGATREGWYVDDVRIYAPQPPVPEPVVPTGLTIRYVGTSLVLKWDTDANLNYKIYSSTIATGPFEYLEGTSTTNAFTISAGPVDARKFYVVVGWDGN
jgi:hypothetical protein